MSWIELVAHGSRLCAAFGLLEQGAASDGQSGRLLVACNALLPRQLPQSHPLCACKQGLTCPACCPLLLYYFIWQYFSFHAGNISDQQLESIV